MKCAIIKRADGGASIGMICDENGEIIAPDIESHLDSIVESNPEFISWRITDHTNLPGAHSDDRYDKTFADAFTDELEGEQLDIDLPKAKAQAHEMRRAKRDADMAPLDRQYTYDPDGAEPLREVVREENAQLQADIDACDCVESLTELMQ